VLEAKRHRTWSDVHALSTCFSSTHEDESDIDTAVNSVQFRNMTVMYVVPCQLKSDVPVAVTPVSSSDVPVAVTGKADSSAKLE
jgi:hypothetical protein